MAMAVQKVRRGAQCTIGPWIERGFYYDFAMPEPIADKDLPKIRKEMQKIIKRNLPFIREEVSAEEARERIQEINEPYKLEILDSIISKDPDAPITIYHIGQPGEKGSWYVDRIIHVYKQIWQFIHHSIGRLRSQLILSIYITFFAGGIFVLDHMLNLLETLILLQ